MTSRTGDIDPALFTYWEGAPGIPDILCDLKFKIDGSGYVILGACQSIYAIVSFTFEVKSPGLMNLAYVGFSSPEHRAIKIKTYRDHPYAKMFEAEFNLWREIRFNLFEYSLPGPVNYNCRWLLRFERPPYPEGIQLLSQDMLEFYGHPIPVDEPAWLLKDANRWWQFWK